MTALQATVIALIAADAITTWYGLRQPWAGETNYLLRHLIDAVGLAPAIVLTHVFTALVVWKLQLHPVILWGAAALFAYAAAGNLRLIWKHR